jgi:DNA-binding NarL/FixJ family response regulator
MDTPVLALIAARPMSLRLSLLALLARLPQIQSIQSVEDTRSMLAVMSVARPPLVVLDVNLVRESSNSVLTQIKASAPETRTVVLVDHIKQQQELLDTSADLVLLKGYPAAELFNRIEQLLVQENSRNHFPE